MKKMSRDVLYRNVLRGLQSSPQLGGCDRSPMTSLTNTLFEATLANTPCKRLSLSSSLSDTPISLKDSSLSSGGKETDISGSSSSSSFVGSCEKLSTLSPVSISGSPRNKENLATPYYSPSRKLSTRHRLSPLREVQNTATRTLSFSPLKKPVSPARREHLSPIKTSSAAPPDDSDSNSRDSGYSESGQKKGEFNVPRSCAPTTRRLNLDVSPFKSPPSEVRRVRSFASLKKKSEEDEFLMEFICGARDISMEDDEETTSSSFSTLLSAPIQSLPASFAASSDGAAAAGSAKTVLAATPTPCSYNGPRLPIRRCLSMIDASTPVSSRTKPEVETKKAKESSPSGKSPTPSFKRPQSPISSPFVNETKRRKEDKVEPTSPLAAKDKPKLGEEHSKVLLSNRQLSNPESCSKDLIRPKFHRSHSESHVSIMKALNMSSSNNGDLIGDFTQPLSLPIIQGGKHPDLKSINIHTMAALLIGEFADKVASFKVLDCRYPYEYEGGHIVNSLNWHHPSMVQEFLNAQKQPPKLSSSSSQRHILIFHCEFSAERGPKAQRMLREIDRTINKEHYPALHFPELYLLEGGYKAFYESYPEFCTPTEYVKMLDENHADDLKFFRSKSRSWAAENKQSRCPLSRTTAKRLGL